MRNSHAPRPKLSARNVWKTCMMPPTMSSHPTSVVTASPATNGSRTANVPSTMKAIAVTMNQVPTLWTTGIGSLKVSTRLDAVIAASLHSRFEGARRLPSRDIVTRGEYVVQPSGLLHGRPKGHYVRHDIL